MHAYPLIACLLTTFCLPCPALPCRACVAHCVLVTCQGLKNLDDIIAEADGIIVGRGDLGVELSAEKVRRAEG